MRVEEFVLDLLDTSGLVFIYFSFCVYFGGMETGTETTSCMEQCQGFIDRITVKSKTRHDHV